MEDKKLMKECAKSFRENGITFRKSAAATNDEKVKRAMVDIAQIFEVEARILETSAAGKNISAPEGYSQGLGIKLEEK